MASSGLDYGHARAVIDTLERKAAVNREQGREIYPDAAARAATERARLEAASWRCSECGAVTDTPRESACEHLFAWNYFMVEDEKPGRSATVEDDG